MIDTIPVPAESKFGAMVARRLNASRPIAPAGSLAMSGPTGTGFSAPPENKRDRRAPVLPAKPFDIVTRTDEETGEPYKALTRCVFRYGERLVELEEWTEFPEEAESDYTLFLHVQLLEVNDFGKVTEDTETIRASIEVVTEEGGDLGFCTSEVVRNHYPLYKMSADGSVLVDYRDALISPNMFYTDGESIAQDHPKLPNVLTLPNFWDEERVMTTPSTQSCLLVVRYQEGGENKIIYVPMTYVMGVGGGGSEEGGGGGAPEWIKNKVVTSLNGAKGDLVLQLSEGWLEILKNGKAVKAVGTLTTSVSGLIGDMAVIGGSKIRVEQEGNALRISYDDGKVTDDVNSFENGEPSCDHPGNEESDGDDTPGKGGGGVSVDENETEDTGGGGGCCSKGGGMSTTGGSGSGSPSQGASGKPTGGATGGGASSPGKKVTTPPSSGSSGTASGSSGKEIKPGSLEAVQDNTKKPIYTGTHNQLTDTKKMNESPFKKSGYKSIEQVQADTKKPIYTGTHSQLTNTKKMNESPFKKASK